MRRLYAVRHFAVRVVVGMMVVLGPALTPVSGAERRVFRYGDGANGGALINDYSSCWVEIVGSEEKYLFEETRRTDDTIELIDRSRDVGLRVHALDGEVRLPNSTAWQPWAQ